MPKVVLRKISPAKENNEGGDGKRHPFEVALRKFKRDCEKAGIYQETRRREFYEKPTWERKRKCAAARKRWLKKLSKEDEVMQKRRLNKRRVNTMNEIVGQVQVTEVLTDKPLKSPIEIISASNDNAHTED